MLWICWPTGPAEYFGNVDTVCLVCVSPPMLTEDNRDRRIGGVEGESDWILYLEAIPRAWANALAAQPHCGVYPVRHAGADTRFYSQVTIPAGFTTMCMEGKQHTGALEIAWASFVFSSKLGTLIIKSLSHYIGSVGPTNTIFFFMSSLFCALAFFLPFLVFNAIASRILPNFLPTELSLLGFWSV